MNTPMLIMPPFRVADYTDYSSRPSGGDTLRASGEARAAYLERPIHPTTDKNLHQPFSSHFVKKEKIALY